MAGELPQIIFLPLHFYNIGWRQFQYYVKFIIDFYMDLTSANIERIIREKKIEACEKTQNQTGVCGFLENEAHDIMEMERYYGMVIAFQKAKKIYGEGGNFISQIIDEEKECLEMADNIMNGLPPITFP